MSGGFAETFFFLYDNDSIQSKSRTCKQIITGSFRQVKNNLSNYPMTYAEQIYEKLHKERRVLVEPIVEPEEQYVDKWEAVPYQGKGFSEDI